MANKKKSDENLKGSLYAVLGRYYHHFTLGVLLRFVHWTVLIYEEGQKYMHIHKYEKYWLVFGVTTLVAFLIILGIGAFHQGSHPNNGKKH